MERSSLGASPEAFAHSLGCVVIVLKMIIERVIIICRGARGSWIFILLFNTVLVFVIAALLAFVQVNVRSSPVKQDTRPPNIVPRQYKPQHNIITSHIYLIELWLQRKILVPFTSINLHLT